MELGRRYNLYMAQVPGIKRILDEIEEAGLEAWYAGTKEKDGEFYRQTSCFLTKSSLIELVVSHDSMSITNYKRSDITKISRHYKIENTYHTGHLRLSTQKLHVSMIDGEQITLPLPEGCEEDWGTDVANFLNKLSN